MAMSIPVLLPRVPARREELAVEIRALPDRAAVELFHQCDIWAATVEDGRDVIGVLNHRYDLVAMECAPGPWVAAAYDTGRGELILAALATERPFDCNRAAQACAVALGESIEHLDCY
jgi:hypothetical protein